MAPFIGAYKVASERKVVKAPLAGGDPGFQGCLRHVCTYHDVHRGSF
jgi:hypothetical protein